MNKLREYGDFIKSVRSTLGYWKSYSLMQFTISLTRIMKTDRVSGKKLAGRLGFSPQQVSKVLKGNENVTIETMAKFANALDAVVHIYVAKKGVQVRWQEVPTFDRVVVEATATGSSTGAVDFAVLRPPANAEYVMVN